MEAQTPYPLAPEETVIRIMRRLSPERVAELVDFARFLDLRTTERFQAWIEAESEHDDQASAAEERWDQLFARPKAKELMRQMAREAREDFHAGRTTEITDTEDGRLAPG